MSTRPIRLAVFASLAAFAFGVAGCGRDHPVSPSPADDASDHGPRLSEGNTGGDPDIPESNGDPGGTE